MFSSRRATKIRIGTEYQAVCPDLQSEEEIQTIRDKDRLMWSQEHNISDETCKCLNIHNGYYYFNLISVFAVNQYIMHVRQMRIVSVEQSLQILLYHGFDVELASLDLTIRRTTKPFEWTVVEQARFHEACKAYGSNFSKIHAFVYKYTLR